MENIDVENLKRVWERVAVPSPGQETGDDLARLRFLIGEEAYEGAFAALLLMKLRGGGAERLLRTIRREEERHLRRLQTEYFLRAGDTWAPPVKKPSAPYLLAALRGRWEAESLAAERYEAAARETSDGALAAVYRELAGEERRHGLLLRDAVTEVLR